MDEDDGRWVEVWKGSDDAKLQAVARRLDAEGIAMRRAWDGSYCETSGGLSLLSLFRRKRNSRLLVAEPDEARARELVRGA